MCKDGDKLKMIKKLKSFFSNYTLLKEEDAERDWYNTNCPEENANLYQRALYTWVERMIWKGYKAPLELRDINDLPKKLKVESNLQYMQDINYNVKYPLIYNCYQKFTKRNWILILLKVIVMVFNVITPMVLRALIQYIQTPNPVKIYAIGLCLALFVCSLGTSVLQQISFWFGMRNALQIRGTLFSIILEKLFKINNSSKRKYNSGRVMNLISIDLEAFLDYFWNNHIDIVLNPVQIAALLIYLSYLVGVAGLVGFLVMIIAIPLTSFFSTKSSRHYLKSLSFSDERVNLVGELISGIRFLKQYAWEKSFLERIEQKRIPQLEEVFKMVLFWMCSSLLTQSLSAIVLLSTFSVYSLLGNELTITIAFTCLTIFVNLRRPIEMLPECFQRLLKLVASSKRIEEFLSSPEIIPSIDYITPGQIQQDVVVENAYFDWNDQESNDIESELVLGNTNLSDTDFSILSQDDDDMNQEMLMSNAIELKPLNEGQNGEGGSSPSIETRDQVHLSIGDTNETSTTRLVNLNFRAPHGKLTIICGSVGCGKSTLIASLIGEIHKIKGTVRSHRNVGFTTQQPFLLSASLRENVLFGKPYERSRYLQVLQACALHVDLNQLPARDLTEIGERGINLSGGQKARISLARALYSDPDCLVLDDPLNAVDTEVAKHLFENCIQGMMSGKTRILVTHQLQFLPLADYIAVFQNDTIIQGTYNELKERGINFESLLKEKQMGLEDHSNSGKSSNEKDDSGSSKILLKPIEELISDEGTSDLLEMAKLVIKEDRCQGAVGLSTYMPFIRAGGSVFQFFFIVFIYAISQIAFQFSDYWLAIWTQQKLGSSHSHSFYLLIYLGIILGFTALMITRYLLLSRFILRSCRLLHRQLLYAIAFASCTFFDTNPSGRILNRFSKDVTDVDVKLLPAASDFMYCFATVIISMLLMIFLNPIIMFPLMLLMVFYYYAQKIYRASSRELKRMESISRSPIYSLAQESFNGIIIIRSLHQADRFIQEMISRVNINQRLYFYSFAVHRWVGVRLELISSLTVLFASILSVFSNNPALGSLSITTALGLTGFLNWSTRSYTEIELKMNSVERVLSYIETPSEDSKIKNKHQMEVLESNNSEFTLADCHDIALPDNWPHTGKIEFKNVEIKYRDNMDPVIRDLSFTIEGNEKIGIVGRTGSGKSTIGGSLLRLVECSEGTILIDGIDISQVSLNDLRQRLSVVPQDPFIFSGSLRLNVDPFDQSTDEEIWNALEKVQLKKQVQNLPMKLQSQMNEAGEGWSVGEKQLLCLCRALLRNSKIILLDESSASLDFGTDQIIKKVIRDNFSQSTVLTIAHRLDTIVDSSRILVIDAGRLLEFDSPQNLIADRNSKFSQLVYAQSNHFK
ncbi:ABC transporter C family protein [Tieghemostelium lacteum]|uniref:ABC transporter C family protein n=1 Tax=Tieghemostelium lacteum TaxID=361077 RepID=A0A152A318_TIELA|nr:ABC transporter C family protein [Tieghemostelium lacteum]|eukprot:KYR00638.1 ABC transporter C family protein [Tieghemostelium lacteum]